MMDAFERLVDLMQRLRAEDGCPWDREQTHASIRRYVIEEAYEVAEAIDQGDPDELRLELGDLLLQVVFHARMAEEAGEFDIAGVCEGIVAKMERRHPHVFGDTEVADAAEVSLNWEAIKARERGADASALDGVPKSMPALQRAERIGEKAAKSGFDWPNARAVLAKVAEESTELEEAIAAGDRLGRAAEFGDLLFSLVNLARQLEIDPEQALVGTVQRFEARFRHAEAAARGTGRALRSLSEKERDTLWEAAKKAQQTPPGR
ncbi:MAG: nucleoside triphosphate pyrophosphohydrolase [Deltaproteobacteria bacterium]